MDTLKKTLALFSLFGLVVVPVVALAATYGTPITINNPTPVADDRFGYSVSIDSDFFVVGAPFDNSGAVDAGFVYLYNATTGALLQTFSNPTPAQDERFGNSVSVSGDKVLIGGLNDQYESSAGSVYLYDATTSDLLHTFNNPTPSSIDGFGSSVSISGDKVLIGAPGDIVAGYNGAGSVYLYDATSGALLRTFNNPIPWAYEYDSFGYSVSVYNDKVLIGVPYKNTGGLDSGLAYLFDATTGAILHTFNNPTPAAGDHFGESVSLADGKVWVGASGDDTGAFNAGSVYLFDVTTGGLLQTFNSPAPASNNSFGRSISISGDKALFSESGNSGGIGSAHLFDATTGVLLHTFNNPTPAAGDSFGSTVSISGDKIVIGAPGDDTGATDVGFAYLYLPFIDTDTDGDGVYDSTDNCPADPNADQTDTDGDGEGDPCDFTPNGDTDSDGVDELVDNCPGVSNASQEDNDNDGIGNVCDPTPDGDPDPNPINISQCQQLDWMDFGFRNQGQCVAFVNTGHDSRE